MKTYSLTLLTALIVGALLTACGPGIGPYPQASFVGFPQYSGYETNTRFIQGKVSLLGVSTAGVSVSIDGASAQSATTTAVSGGLRWQIALPARSSNPAQWTLGSRHTAAVNISDSAGKSLGNATGTFRMGLLRDANADGFADLVAGAPFADIYSTDDGAFYYFPSVNGVFSWSNATRVTDPTAETGGIQMGFRSAMVGDLNGDGYADAVHSVALSSGAGPARGGVYISYGSASGLNTGSMTRLNCSGCANSTRFGFGFAAADFNNDGFDDLVVGSRTQAAYLYLGTSGGLPGTPSATLNYPDGDTSVFFGTTMDAIADITGDGYPDLLVGATQSDASGSIDGGATYVYAGSSLGLPTTALVTLIPTTPTVGGAFGRNSPVGDVNADGVMDFITSTINDTAGGLLSLYYGSGSTAIPTTPSFLISNPTSPADALFGHSVTATQDLNGDSVDDFVVGAPGNSPGTIDGVAHFYLGKTSSSVPTLNQTLTYPGTDTSARFGRQVCSFDVNSDGLMDLIVGADYSDIGAVDSGAIFVYLRGPSGFSAAPDMTLAYPEADTGVRFGLSLCVSN